VFDTPFPSWDGDPCRLNEFSIEFLEILGMFLPSTMQITFFTVELALEK